MDYTLKLIQKFICIVGGKERNFADGNEAITELEQNCKHYSIARISAQGVRSFWKYETYLMQLESTTKILSLNIKNGLDMNRTYLMVYRKMFFVFVFTIGRR